MFFIHVRSVRSMNHFSTFQWSILILILIFIKIYVLKFADACKSTLQLGNWNYFLSSLKDSHHFIYLQQFQTVVRFKIGIVFRMIWYNIYYFSHPTLEPLKPKVRPIKLIHGNVSTTYFLFILFHWWNSLNSRTAQYTM